MVCWRMCGAVAASDKLWWSFKYDKNLQWGGLSNSGCWGDLALGLVSRWTSVKVYNGLNWLAKVVIPIERLSRYILCSYCGDWIYLWAYIFGCVRAYPWIFCLPCCEYSGLAQSSFRTGTAHWSFSDTPSGNAPLRSSGFKPEMKKHYKPSLLKSCNVRASRWSTDTGQTF